MVRFSYRKCNYRIVNFVKNKYSINKVIFSTKVAYLFEKPYKSAVFEKLLRLT